MAFNDISKNQVDELFNQLLPSIRKHGYYFNHDESYTKGILKGLLFNEKRYGYQSCPCRLASGVKAEDLDIICPCYYRDADVAEFGTCVCGLYVSKKVYENKEKIKSIPERRPAKEFRLKADQPGAERYKNMQNENKPINKLSYPVWRCEICGYICARDEAPDVCPICGATKERFSRFI
jgi:ferredoxin-thioredoxin reductase catalytic subunit